MEYGMTIVKDYCNPYMEVLKIRKNKQLETPAAFLFIPNKMLGLL
jgi:hypothetical protein